MCFSSDDLDGEEDDYKEEDDEDGGDSDYDAKKDKKGKQLTAKRKRVAGTSLTKAENILDTVIYYKLAELGFQGCRIPELTLLARARVNV